MAYCLRYGKLRIPLVPGNTTVGASPFCSFVLRGTDVSARHATLRVTATRVEIAPVGRASVSINGAPASGPTSLKLGDAITIGQETVHLDTIEARTQRYVPTHANPSVSSDPTSGTVPVADVVDERKSG